MTAFTFATFSSGSTFVMSYPTGYGSPRIFEGGAFYLYNMSHLLMKSSDGSSWSDVGNGLTPLAVCQDSLDTPARTLMFVSNGASYYQATPESTGGWTTSGSTSSEFMARDAVTDLQGSIGVVVGNNHSGTESRIVKSALSAPYSFADSDAGIPQTSGSIALITDLEVGE